MSMDYTEISIRVTFPPEISDVIKREKERLVLEYGSKYRSAPHITLYLARYTADGVLELVAKLKKLIFKEFVLKLLGPKLHLEGDRNAYILDISNKPEIEELHNQITIAASLYQSPLLRDADQRRMAEDRPHKSALWYPHITLGTISVDVSQPSMVEIEKNLQGAIGKQVSVSSITIFVYEREKDEEKARFIEEVTIPFISS